jgi:uncharacterized protein (TIGR03083 family)
MKPVEPILTAGLFAPLHGELLGLLRQLAPADWDRPTVAVPWSVKDVVAHLLDTDIRRVSSLRDRYAAPPDTPVASYRDLVDLIDRLNADWVKAARRISPQLLIELHALIGPQVSRLFEALDPYAPAAASVAWAGEESSPNWFDIAREYTEKWHHQQHIREAVGAPGLTSRIWLQPALDTFLRGLPHTYRAVSAPDGAGLTVQIAGAASGEWTLVKHPIAWRLYVGSAPDAAARVRLDQDTAWRLFTRGITPAEARTQAQIEGDEELGAHLLELLAIMA